MIVKESQLQKNWPVILSPEQREQFLQEKVARVQAWYQHLKQHEARKSHLERS